MSKLCGIYTINNIINNHKYIGSSNYIQKRWIRHKLDLRNNIHHSIYLQRAYNLYGLENFEFKIIELCDQTNLIIKEQQYLDKLTPEYNISKIAERFIPTEESKKNQSIKMSGNKHPFYGKKRPEHSKLMTGTHNPFYRKQHSLDSKMKSALKHIKIKKEDVEEIKKLKKLGIKQIELSNRFNISPAQISRILNNKTIAWSDDV